MARFGRAQPPQPKFGKPPFFPPPTMYLQSFDDTITITDSGITRAFTRVWNETVTLSETFQKAITKILSDASITITDTYSSIQGRGIEFNEIITMTETFIKNITRIFSETITLTEVFSTAKGYVKSLTDTITMSDTFSKVTAFLKTFNDTINLTDHFNAWLNGLNILWSKVARAVGSWTKQVRNTDNWTKQEKP